MIASLLMFDRSAPFTLRVDLVDNPFVWVAARPAGVLHLRGRMWMRPLVLWIGRFALPAHATHLGPSLNQRMPTAPGEAASPGH